MAKIRSGVLGNTRGKVAGVVGSQWKDTNYLREYVKPANPNTTAQQNQRSIFKSAVAMAKPIVGPILNTYVSPFRKSMSGFNWFLSQNMDSIGSGGDLADVKVTSGNLYPAEPIEAEYNEVSGDVVLDLSTSEGSNGSATDNIHAAVFDSNRAIWYLDYSEASRTTGQTTITVPSGKTASDLYTYSWLTVTDFTSIEGISDSKGIQCVAA